MKTLIAAALLLTTLTACGASTSSHEMDCHAAGGEVTVVGTQASCLKDGAVIAKWVSH